MIALSQSSIDPFHRLGKRAERALSPPATQRSDLLYPNKGASKNGPRMTGSPGSRYLTLVRAASPGQGRQLTFRRRFTVEVRLNCGFGLIMSVGLCITSFVTLFGRLALRYPSVAFEPCYRSTWTRL